MVWPWSIRARDNDTWSRMAAETGRCLRWRLRRGAPVVETSAPLEVLTGKLPPGFIATPAALAGLVRDHERADLARLWRLPIDEDITLTLHVATESGPRVLRVRAQGKGLEVLGVMADVTGQVEAEEALGRMSVELRELASEDTLTGLNTRRQFEMALNTEFKRAVRSGQPLGLVLADVDHFRSYNQQHGRAGGDALLHRVSQALKAMPRRAGDVLARYDSAVFGLLLPLANESGAMHVAGTLLQAVRSVGIKHPAGEDGYVTLSAGATSFMGLGETGNQVELMRRAQKALQLAKEKGRNRVGRYAAGRVIAAPQRTAPLSQEEDRLVKTRLV